MNQVITLTSATGFQVSAKRPPAGVLLILEQSYCSAVMGRCSSESRATVT